MPMYTYECKRCHQRGEKFWRMDEVQSWIMCACGGKATRQYMAPQVNVFREYVSSDFDGVPRKVVNRAQEKDLCAINHTEIVSNSDSWKPKKPKMELRPFKEDFERIKAEYGLGTEKAKEVLATGVLP